jgi:peptide/nickel transport system permease protein
MSGTVAAPAETPSPARLALTALLRRTPVRIGLGIIILFLLVTILAHLIAPYDPADQNLSAALSPPALDHIFGADQYGRDVFSRVLFGTRDALLAIIVADASSESPAGFNRNGRLASIGTGG